MPDDKRNTRDEKSFLDRMATVQGGDQIPHSHLTIGHQPTHGLDQQESCQDVSSHVDRGSDQQHPESRDLKPHDLLRNRFELQRILGRGGMGIVWRAFDREADVPVVIKVLPERFRNNESELQRVKDAYRAVHNLSHQHLCPVRHFETDDSIGAFIVMRFLDGYETLSRYRRRYMESSSRFSEAEVVRLLAPVADALDYAHNNHVIHRDIKPSNILVKADTGDVQVIDFGLAITTVDEELQATDSQIAGTFPYMSPEQWRGESLCGRTDQYALAVVAYEMLAGRLPFDEPTRRAEKLKERVCQMLVPPIRDRTPRVNAVLKKGLTKTADDRFENCRALIAALDKKSSELALRTPPPTPQAPVRTPVNSFDASIQTRPSPTQRPTEPPIPIELTADDFFELGTGEEAFLKFLRKVINRVSYHEPVHCPVCDKLFAGHEVCNHIQDTHSGDPFFAKTDVNDPHCVMELTAKIMRRSNASRLEHVESETVSDRPDSQDSIDAARGSARGSNHQSAAKSDHAASGQNPKRNTTSNYASDVAIPFKLSGRRFLTRDAIQRQLAIVPTDSQVECPFCEKAIPVDVVLQHVDRFHRHQLKVGRSKTLNRQRNRRLVRDALKKRIRSVKSDENLKCPFCSAGQVKAENFLRHLDKHHADELADCSVSDLVLKTSDGKEFAAPGGSNSSGNSPKDIHSPSSIDGSSETVRVKQRHAQSIVPSIDSDAPSVNKRPEKFTDPVRLTYLQCFSYKDAAVALSKIPPGKRRVECPYCGIVMQKENFLMHLKSVH